MKPETLGRTGEGKVFSVFENYHLPDIFLRTTLLGLFFMYHR